MNLLSTGLASAGLFLLATPLVLNGEEQPNIILIVADDLGAHTLSIDGNPIMETLNIDRLERSGTSFSHGYAPAPVCKPSRAALLSGQYAPRTGVYRVADRHKGHEDKIRLELPDNAPYLPLGTLTIAEVLQDNGYRTGHFGKWHLHGGDRGLPGEQGFDTTIVSAGGHFNPKTVPEIEMPDGSYIGDVLTDRAISFMDEALNEETPFFLYMPYFLIHKPLEAKQEHLEHFREKLGSETDAETLTVAAMTKSLDENIGKLVEYLDKEGLRENTLVIFTSDNGGYKMPDNLLNAPLRGRKGDLYEGGIRVPTIFSWKGKVPENREVHDPVTGVDLFPTIVSATGARLPKEHNLDGVDLLPLLLGDVSHLQDRPLYWYFPKYAGWNNRKEVWRDEWRNVIQENGYKLIEYRESSRLELYNLNEDPNETKDLSKELPELARQLQAKLLDWKGKVGAPEETPNSEYTGPLANDEFQAFEVDDSIDLPTASKAAHEAWKDQRFGMFIHWGPISQMGTPLSHSRNSPSHRSGGRPYKVADIPPEVYDVQYKTFNPVEFDPDGMIKMAKAAGVEYIVFTAKHHAGFSMFDSAVTEYDIMSAPYGKDITMELANAAQDNGIDFGFYYSPRDWYNPDCDSDEHHDRYIRFYKAQMRELLENYGPIHSIFFDGLGPGDWGNTAAEIMAMIRERHPDAMVNDRGGAGADYYTPEHYISYFNNEESWEACHTTTSQWGYNPTVNAKPFNELMEILLYTWGSGGNVLLNIGPMGNGAINPVEHERFQQISAWWAVHGEKSIRETRGGPYLPGPWGVSTRKDNSIFLHVFSRDRSTDSLDFPAFEGMNVKDVKRLDGGSVDFTILPDAYRIQLPAATLNEISTTVELVMDKPTRNLGPVQRVPSLMNDAGLTASHNTEEMELLHDQDASTEWYAWLKPEDNQEIWLEARFDEPVAIGSFAGQRGEHWAPKHRAELQVPDDDGGWKTVSDKFRRFRFTTINFLPEPITTDRVRLRIHGIRSYSNPQHFVMSEWELFPPLNN